jgi:hypothetical protein
MQNNSVTFDTFKDNIFSNTQHDKVMHIDIYIGDVVDDELKKLYIESSVNHNKKIFEDPHFYDAGFDLFLPKNLIEKEVKVYGDGTRFFGNNGWKWEGPNPHINKVNFKVKCCAKMYKKILDSHPAFYYTPFYTYARSSISKTPLRLANNQGIIDAGYRGPLIGMFDCIYDNKDDKTYNECDFYMEAHSRVLQICAPDLVPIFVNVVDKLEDLGPSTARGSGGIGSTGK